MARRLNLPARTWYNYETGVTVPAEVLLAFIDQTGANPVWLLSGEGDRFRPSYTKDDFAEMTPVQLIRRGLEKLERQPPVAVLTAESAPVDGPSDFVAVGLVALGSLLPGAPVPAPEGHILAYREWLPHPQQTIAVRLEDDAMNPILPAGSVVAVDRTLLDPDQLQGKMVAAAPDGRAMVRWLDLSGRHLIFRPNQPSREYPMIPMELNAADPSPILGQIVWSWSCFNDFGG